MAFKFFARAACFAWKCARSDAVPGMHLYKTENMEFGHAYMYIYINALDFTLQSRYWIGLMGSLAAIEHLTALQPRKMSEDSCTELKRAYLTYRSALNSLATFSVQAEQCRYLIRPKVHQLGHLIYHFGCVNPRYSSNFLDEDFMGFSKGLASKAHPLFMPVHVLNRYSIAVTLRWNNYKFH